MIFLITPVTTSPVRAAICSKASLRSLRPASLMRRFEATILFSSASTLITFTFVIVPTFVSLICERGMKNSTPFSSYATYPPLFLLAIFTSNTFSAFSSYFAIKSATFDLARAFLCDTIGRPPLEPVIRTSILSPILYFKEPSFAVISLISITPSDFLRTSTRTSLSLILTISPSHREPFDSFLKDSSSRVAKSSSVSWIWCFCTAMVFPLIFIL